MANSKDLVDPKMFTGFLSHRLGDYIERMLSLDRERVFSGADFKVWHACFEALVMTLKCDGGNVNTANDLPMGYRCKPHSSANNLRQLDVQLADSIHFVDFREAQIERQAPVSLKGGAVFLLGEQVPGFDILKIEKTKDGGDYEVTFIQTKYSSHLAETDVDMAEIVESIGNVIWQVFPYVRKTVLEVSTNTTAKEVAEEFMKADPTKMPAPIDAPTGKKFIEAVKLFGLFVWRDLKKENNDGIGPSSPLQSLNLRQENVHYMQTALRQLPQKATQVASGDAIPAEWPPSAMLSKHQLSCCIEKGAYWPPMNTTMMGRRKLATYYGLFGKRF